MTPLPTGLAAFPYLSCDAPAVQIGQTVYELIVTGDEAPSFGPMTDISGQYYEFAIVTPTPTPSPTPTRSPTPTPTPTVFVSPTPTPTPSPTPRQVPVYLYDGTYAVSSTTAPTTGCFYLITTTDGSPLYGGALTYSALGGGEPNSSGIPPYTVSNLSTGTTTAFNLSLTSSGSGSGSFTLEDGDTGTISISGRSTVVYTEALRRMQALRRLNAP
ncbi:MAG TPA: hypothetical protein VME66_01345 [Candidatus Acidoferrales bacterium]|nr:hypothetical protein [Candidatus Acidoferrales bacterium]